MPQGKSPEPDPAAEAFEALRGEVALLRRAVTGLAAERTSFDIPDYSESIGQLTSMVSSMSKRLAAFSGLPAFALSPESFSRQVLSASEAIRRQDQETILIGRDALREAISEVTRSVRSARQADRQNKWLISCASASALLGMFVGVFLVVPILRRLGIPFG